MHRSILATHGTVHDLKVSDSWFTNLARGYTFDLAATQPSIVEVDNYTSMQLPGAGGGLISNASDLLKWNNALFSGKIIPHFIVELMLVPYIQSEKENEYYGYGIEIKSSNSFGKYYRHPGGIPGFKTRLTFIPKWQLSIVILENVYANQNSLLSEIKAIKSSLPATQSEFDKNQQTNQILESKYPCIVENRRHYQMTPLEDSILTELEHFNDEHTML